MHGSGRGSGVFESCNFDKTGSFWVFAGIGQRFELPENLRGSAGDKRDNNVCLRASYQRLSHLPPGVHSSCGTGGPGFPVMWRFSSCQNCLVKRTPGRTLFGHGDCCSPRLAGTGIIRYWWAADARVERRGARPNRVVMIKTALTCVC